MSRKGCLCMSSATIAVAHEITFHVLSTSRGLVLQERILVLVTSVCCNNRAKGKSLASESQSD
eukprot:3405000-Amphidinium_carterae.1